MDEVWILSLCLTVFAFFLFILTLKPNKDPEPESISKKSAPSTSYVSSGGKSLELKEDDVEKMMERLNKLLYQDEPKKKEVPQERRKPVQEKAPESPLHDKDSESPPETQEPGGKGPAHTQPANQPSHHRVQEKSTAPAVENIMDEIEQAVQENVELDYYARRRQERAAARTKHTPETDSQ